MSSVRVSSKVAAPAERVWASIRDFGGCQKYMPVLVACSADGNGVGARRTMTMVDGAEIVEVLEQVDDAGRTMVYRMVDGPMVRDYVCTVQVREIGAQACEVSWSSTFEPVGAPESDLKAIIEGVYGASVGGLRELHEPS